MRENRVHLDLDGIFVCYGFVYLFFFVRFTRASYRTFPKRNGRTSVELLSENARQWLESWTKKKTLIK